MGGGLRAPVVLAVESDPWRFVPHPEVWLLVVGVAALYTYAIRRIGPRATRPHETVVTRSQVAWFVAALALLWVASDWPVHDIAERYLYSVHMVQHLLLSLVVPPMFLLATPTWLARMIVGDGTGYRVLRIMTRALPALLLYNAMVAVTHVPWVVTTSATNGAFHYLVHVAVVGAAFIMWMPVAGPLPELRFSLPVQMLFLFGNSILPTVPAGWLTFAENPVYHVYDIPVRVFDLSVTHDQQLAGFTMKVLGGFFLWVIIATLFIRFADKAREDDRARGVELDRRAPVEVRQPVPAADEEPLTWTDVEEALAKAGPPPPDPADRAPG